MNTSAMNLHAQSYTRICVHVHVDTYMYVRMHNYVASVALQHTCSEME